MPSPYELDLTAAQINTALNNAHDSGDPPTSGSGKLVDSDQIHSFVTQQVGALDPTDGFVPTNYAGGESVTLPNGLILKFGRIESTSDDTTITFGTAFPNALIFSGATQENTSNTSLGTPVTHGSTRSVSSVNFRHGGSADYLNWFALGW